MRLLVSLTVLLLSAGCGASPELLDYSEIENAPDWWRLIATADDSVRIAGVEADREAIRVRNDSLGWRTSDRPINYAGLLNDAHWAVPRHALALLMNTEEFASESVGFGHQPSDQVIAFNTLLRLRNAEEVFQDLLARGRTAGRLYALTGLYIVDVDRSSFEAALDRFEVEGESVDQSDSCVVSEVQVEWVLDQIRSGYWPDRLRDI